MKKKVLVCVACIVVIAAVAVVCVFKSQQPKQSLLDKAMELENGQLLCADGTLWQRDEDAQELNVIVKCGKLRGEIPEPYVQGEIPINMLPFEYATYSTEKRAVFLDNTGGVWRLKNEAEDYCVIEPFYVEEELPKVAADGVTVQRWEINKIWVEVEDPDIELQPFFVVGVHLSDGWHNISKGSMETIVYSTNKRKYEGVFELPTNVKGEFRVEAYVPRNGEYYYGQTIWIELSW